MLIIHLKKKKNHLAQHSSTILTLSINRGVLQSDGPKGSCLVCGMNTIFSLEIMLKQKEAMCKVAAPRDQPPANRKSWIHPLFSEHIVETTATCLG